MGLQVNYVRKWGRDFAAWRDTVGTYVQVPVVDDAGQDPTGTTSNVFRLTSNPGLRANSSWGTRTTCSPTSMQ